jgi:hypothetical protein
MLSPSRSSRCWSGNAGSVFHSWPSPSLENGLFLLPEQEQALSWADPGKSGLIILNDRGTQKSHWAFPFFISLPLMYPTQTVYFGKSFGSVHATVPGEGRSHSWLDL